MSGGRTVLRRDVAPGEELDPRLAALLPSDDERARWTLDRTGYGPVVYFHRDGRHTAAALTTSRAGSAALKIVDVVADDPELVPGLLDTVIEDARRRGQMCVKWEARRRADAEWAEKRGFSRLDAPIRSGPGSEQPQDGYMLWLGTGELARRVPYYRQTVAYTCGPVSALLGASLFAAPQVSGEQSWNRNHDREMSVWRRATMSFPCEPYGLVVALREMLLRPEEAQVRLYMDREAPFVVPVASGFRADVRAALAGAALEWYDAQYAEFRERTVALQNDLRRRARELGIPVHATRLVAADIVREVADGAVAMVMISQSTMHPGDLGGHWIVVHGVRDGLLMAQDPWVAADRGESWVDGTQLPLTPSALDEMSSLGGADAYRAVILLSPPEQDDGPATR